MDNRLLQSSTRRHFFSRCGMGLGSVALASLMDKNVLANPYAPRRPHVAPKAKNVIYLYLAGGPPQHETFDPKPNAPEAIRGVFNPIHTNVPGIQFCELLPRTARIADKLAICRAMSTNDNTHSTRGYWGLTGFP